MFDAAKLISNNVPNRDSPAPKLKHRFLCHVGGALLTVASTTLSICAVTSPAAAHQEFSDGTAQKVNEAAVQRDLAASTVSLAFGEAEAATCKTATAEAADAPTNLRQGILIDTDKSSIRMHIEALESANRAVVGNRSVYAGLKEQTSTVIQNCSGVTRIIKVIEGSLAPKSYRFRFDLAPDMRLVQGSSGGIAIEQGDKVVGYIEAPWAVDATGAKVQTEYTVEGDNKDTLVQTVSHEGAHYPVTADPSISAGKYWYVRYSKSEVSRVNVTLVQAGDMAALSLACGTLAEMPVLAAACTALGSGYISSVMGQVRDAANAGQCILHRYLLTPVVLVHWDRYNC